MSLPQYLCRLANMAVLDACDAGVTSPDTLTKHGLQFLDELCSLLGFPERDEILAAGADLPVKRIKVGHENYSALVRRRPVVLPEICGRLSNPCDL